MKELILNKLCGEELARIVDEHMNLSQALGFSIGIHGKNHDDQPQKQPAIVDLPDTVTCRVMMT